MVAVSTVEKVLFLPDVHAPYQDERCISLVLDFKADWRPTMTVAMGDWVDGTHVGSYKNDIGQYDTLDEFIIGNDLLDRLRPDIYLEGNHEERFYRGGNIPQGYRRLLCPKHWLNIKKRGIRWYPYSNLEPNVLTIGDLSVIHGFNFSKYATLQEALRFGPVLHGHTHRFQVIQHPHYRDEVVGYNAGCLCKLNQNYAETRQPTGWSNGFAFGYFYRSGHYTLNLVKIPRKGKVVHINEKEYHI